MRKLWSISVQKGGQARLFADEVWGRIRDMDSNRILYRYGQAKAMRQIRLRNCCIRIFWSPAQHLLMLDEIDWRRPWRERPLPACR